MDSKNYRLREMLNQVDGHSLVVDASSGLALGALPGLERFTSTVEPLLPLIDGLVISPGQARRFIDLTGSTRTITGARHPAVPLMMRADWTNAIRPADFVLPPETIHRTLLLDPGQGLELGANALVLYFLLGHEETIEAGCLRDAVQFAVQGSQAGIPLILDVQPLGPRVVLRSKAIALGVSYALEGGADGVAVPWPGEDTFKLILAMAAGAPVWVKPGNLSLAASQLTEALSLGAVGLWLDERVFAAPDPAGTVRALNQELHPRFVAGQIQGG